MFLYRSNWLAVTDNLLFADPFKTRKITPAEADALMLLRANLGGMGAAILDMVHGSYTNRITKNEEEFHSRAYKRSKKSCSYIVQFCTPSTNEHQYGEIQEFASIGNLHAAFMKCFPQVITNICQNAIVASGDKIVHDFSSAMVLGSQHVPVASNSDSVLEAVLCENILAKCIVVESNEAFVHLYITPVIDVNCT